AIALKQADCEVVHYQLQEALDYQIGEDFWECMTADLDMIWLCNPNNPTGQLTDKSFMLKLLERCKALAIRLVVDECFIDFVEEGIGYSVIDQVALHPSLVVLKAFTKFFGMAGLRLGYALIGDLKLKSALEKSAQPWAVSSLAQLAGEVALEDTLYSAQTKSLIKLERGYLKQAFERLGFTTYASYADYLFFKSPIPNLHAKLAEKGILIRHCENYKGLTKDYYRVGIKTHKLNVFLVTKLEELIQ
ncbi:MAG: aminotransferase class I/II-fold pyridoxal phosphate-dependent enzyme, partial [Niameybacter sp.]